MHAPCTFISLNVPKKKRVGKRKSLKVFPQVSFSSDVMWLVVRQKKVLLIRSKHPSHGVSAAFSVLLSTRSATAVFVVVDTVFSTQKRFFFVVDYFTHTHLHSARNFRSTRWSSLVFSFTNDIVIFPLSPSLLFRMINCFYAGSSGWLFEVKCHVYVRVERMDKFPRGSRIRR